MSLCDTFRSSGSFPGRERPGCGTAATLRLASGSCFRCSSDSDDGTKVWTWKGRCLSWRRNGFWFLVSDFKRETSPPQPQPLPPACQDGAPRLRNAMSGLTLPVIRFLTEHLENGAHEPDYPV